MCLIDLKICGCHGIGTRVRFDRGAITKDARSKDASTDLWTRAAALGSSGAAYNLLMCLPPPALGFALDRLCLAPRHVLTEFASSDGADSQSVRAKERVTASILVSLLFSLRPAYALK